MRVKKAKENYYLQITTDHHCSECDFPDCWKADDLKCFVGIKKTWENLNTNPQFYYLKGRY